MPDILRRAWNGQPLTPGESQFVHALGQAAIAILAAVISALIDQLAKGPLDPKVLYPILGTAALGALLNVLLRFGALQRTQFLAARQSGGPGATPHGTSGS